MSEFKPVETLEDLATLDDREVIEGYWAGKDGWPEPGNNRTRSYWHGWRNGAVDGKHRKKDAAQAKLASLAYAQTLSQEAPKARDT